MSGPELWLCRELAEISWIVCNIPGALPLLTSLPRQPTPLSSISLGPRLLDCAVRDAVPEILHIGDPSKQLLSAACHRGLDSRDIVATFDDDQPFLFLSAAFASATGRRLIRLRSDTGLAALTDAASSARSLTLIMTLSRCRELGVEILKPIRATRVCFGLLTASTPEQLSIIMARTLRWTPERLHGHHYHVGPVTPVRLNGLESVNLPAHPSPTDLPSFGVYSPFVAFSGHGRSYCALDGNLCTGADPREGGDKRCVGDHQCFYHQRSRRPANQLKGGVAVLESCAAGALVSTGPDADMGTNVSVQLLVGSCVGVIAPYRNHVPNTMTVHLAWDSFAQGLTLGETCSRLNEHARNTGSTDAPFLLYGDPMLRPFMPEYTRETIHPAESATETYQVRNEPGAIRTYTLSRPKVTSKPQPRAVASAVNCGCLASAVPAIDGDGLELLVGWDHDVPSGLASVILTHAPVVPLRYREAIREFLGGLSSMQPWLALDDETARSRIFDQLEHIRTLGVAGSRLDQMTVTRESYEAGMQVGREGLSSCAEIGDQLLRRLGDAATADVLWLHTHARATSGLMHDVPVSTSEECSYCGLPLLARRYQTGFWQQEKRQTLECERCLTVADIPSDATSVPVLDCPLNLELPARFGVAVRGRNDSASHALVQAKLVMDSRSGASGAASVVATDSVKLLGPKSTYHFSFECDVLPVESAHTAWLHAIVLINGRPSCAMRRVNLKAS